MGPRRSLRSAILLVAACAAVAGCARVPALRSVLATHYAGYDQVLPASEALPNEKRYEYLPGNIAAFTLSAPRDLIVGFVRLGGVAWNAGMFRGRGLRVLTVCHRRRGEADDEEQQRTTGALWTPDGLPSDGLDVSHVGTVEQSTDQFRPSTVMYSFRAT